MFINYFGNIWYYIIFLLINIVYNKFIYTKLYYITMELNIWLSWNNKTNENFVNLIMAVVKTNKDNLINSLTYENTLEELKSDNKKKKNVIDILNKMIEFIQVLKENPSVMSTIMGWKLKEIKPEEINMENIKQFIKEIIKEFS